MPTDAMKEDCIWVKVEAYCESITRRRGRWKLASGKTRDAAWKELEKETVVDGSDLEKSPSAFGEVDMDALLDKCPKA